MNTNSNPNEGLSPVRIIKDILKNILSPERKKDRNENPQSGESQTSDSGRQSPTSHLSNLLMSPFRPRNNNIAEQVILPPPDEDQRIIRQNFFSNFSWIDKLLFTFTVLSIFLLFWATLSNYQNVSLNYFSVYISMFTFLLAYFQYNNDNNLRKPQYLILTSFTIVFLVSLFQPYTGIILSTLVFLYIILGYFEYPNSSQDLFKLMSVFFLYFSFSFFLMARMNSVSYHIYYTFLSLGILSFCFFQFHRTYSFVVILFAFLFTIELFFSNLDSKISNYLFNFIIILSIVKFTIHLKSSEFFNFTRINQLLF